MVVRILRTGEMAAADRLAAEQVGGMGVLMERAGRFVADQAASLFLHDRLHVLCGPGNNGGDGFVAARFLRQQGHHVHVYADEIPPDLSDEARTARSQWRGEIRPLEAALEIPVGACIIDALFGAGLSRPLEGVITRLAELSGSANVLAVDVPSGVPGNTGMPDGAHFRASRTVTFAAKKPAHLLLPGRALCGDVVVGDIGINESVLASVSGSVFENAPDLWLDGFPWPADDTHKHRRGRLSVVSGPASATGAARLAARAGLRVGAGLVTLRCEPAATLVLSITNEAVMVKPFGSPEDFGAMTEDDHALVIGPAAGFTETTKVLARSWLGTAKPVVLDADALSVFATDPGELLELLHGQAVLTPHAGEFARIFPEIASKAASPLEAACTAAAASGAIILLKGSSTCIAAPDGRAAVNVHASPWLATAGAGDVLAGLVGGLLAQGMEPFAAACAAAWMHGDAALRFGPGLIAEDLPDVLPEVLEGLRREQPAAS
jgi:ADP-dependent NAD(P)H-hydrate dehydratase / NAD(P)H-hydrate epimerase